MSNVSYKQYSPEEDRIYTEAMAAIQGALKQGIPFDEACKAVSIEDEALRGYVVDDALKIVIAELHFGKGVSLEEVAKALQITLHRVVMASMEMLEDAGISASALYHQQESGGPVGNA